MTLEGRVCLVTGAAGGIGGATGRRLQSAGAVVIATDVAGVPDFGGPRIGCDLTDAAAVEELWRRVDQEVGRIDGLVNVVGISGRRHGDGPLHECSDEGFDRLIDTNLRTVFRMTRAALTRMLRQGTGGGIVNVGSVLAESPSPRHFATHAYAATKAAIVGLTRSAAAYYAPHGIRLNVLAPGLIATPMSQRAASDPAIGAYILEKQALGGMGTAEDCAAAAAFLLSDDSRFITGAVLPVDGGWSVRG